MFDPHLLATVARSMATHFSMNRQPHMSGDPLQRLGAQELRRLTDATQAALEALCEARPDVAAVLQGEAVVMPLCSTEEMCSAGYDATRLADGQPQFYKDGFCLGHADKIYQAMVAVSPYITLQTEESYHDR